MTQYHGYAGYYPAPTPAQSACCGGCHVAHSSRPVAPAPICGCNASQPPVLKPADVATAKGTKAFSTSHVFTAPDTGSLELSLISLLQQSQTGHIGVHSVDIDVRQTRAGVMLQRGNGVDVIYAGGSRTWSGIADATGTVGSANDFTLTLLKGDEVVINWTEIKA